MWRCLWSQQSMHAVAQPLSKFGKSASLYLINFFVHTIRISYYPDSYIHMGFGLK